MVEKIDNQHPINEERSRTPGQYALITAHKIMSHALVESAAAQPAFREEFSRLVHDPRMSYKRIVNFYLNPNERPIAEAVENPIIRAFEVTPLCTEDERVLISRIRDMSNSGVAPSPETLSEYQTWLTIRTRFIMQGLRYFVNHSGVIEPLSDEEKKSKGRIGDILWRESNPEKAAATLRRAQNAFKEKARPYTFTDKIRGKIQEWFDRNLDYQTVAELLRGEGIVVSADTLKDAVSRHPDLVYTRRLIKEQEKLRFDAALKWFSQLTDSSEEIINFFETLGYKKESIKRAMKKQSIRTKANS